MSSSATDSSMYLDIDITFEDPAPRLSRRPTSIPSFNVDDYARRTDASVVGSAIAAMPPLGQMMLRYGTPRIRTAPKPKSSKPRMTAGFAALLRDISKDRTT